MAVLIISHLQDDIDLVIDWISYFKKQVYKIDFEDFIKKFQFEIILNGNNNNNMHLKGVEIESIWFRRDNRLSFTEKKDINELLTSLNIKKSFENEIIALKRILFNKSNNTIRWLSEYNSVDVDKFLILKTAQEIGINIPETIITNNKQDLMAFINRKEKIICKASGENLSFIYKNMAGFMQYTHEMSLYDLDQISDQFFPTLFQEKIDKFLDVRVFYLNSNIYSMGILSQSVDFREDYGKHRYIPMKLPDNVENQIRQLMRKLNFNTGSIDFILDKSAKRFYFLEINPNGQFSMISEPCNYNLHKKIASFLCHGQ